MRLWILSLFQVIFHGMEKEENINRIQEKEENLCPHASAHKSTVIMLYLNHNAVTEPEDIHTPQHMIMWF